MPGSLTEALGLLGDDPSLTVLAGGTDLMVELNYGRYRPGGVLSLRRVDELRGWRVEGSDVVLGAATTYTDLLQPDLARLLPALAQAARTVGGPQIRNTGTIGGNLGTASPAGDTLPVLVALDAQVELASASGRRTLPVAKFVAGPKRTALRLGELITAVRVPAATGPQEFLKVGVRNAMVIAIANCALVVDVDRRSIGCALGAVGPVSIRDRAAEDWLAEQVDWDALTAPDDVIDEFGRRMAAASRPIDDHRSPAAYRRHAVEVMARRALARVTSRRRDGAAVGAGATMSADGARGLQPSRGVAPIPADDELVVNGVRRRIDGAHHTDSLLRVLRDELGLPGSKNACEQGECGSCSVLVDGVLVCACLELATAAAGCEVISVEGLPAAAAGAVADTSAAAPATAEPGETLLTDVQRAMVEAGGVQCGFCTPGLVVAVHDLLDRVPAPAPLEVREALAGNLCRCTGYGRILAAVEQVVALRGHPAGARNGARR
jgi:xanthine dehydrogenase iron-sulfur cluster and FAD-binding subunit A